ncbi:MAG: MFS transporter [Firmicutes bacterium]|nr:MFS transporter [Bacillota bacterium]
MTEQKKDIFDSPAYRRSRGAYYIQCAAEYLVTLVVADAFLAKLLNALGLSDAAIGIVSSLTSLAFLVQLGTIFLMQHIRNVKKTVIFLDISSMLCFMATYLLPFLEAPQVLRTALVFATIGGGFGLKYLQLNLYYKWGQSFVRPGGRGTFSAKNEAISQAAGVAFTLVIGAVVDYYDRVGRLETSFLVIACVIACLTVVNFVMLLSIQSYSRREAVSQQKPIRDVLKNTLGNPNFRHVIVMISLYDIGRYLTVGFLGTYKTQDLLLTVGTVEIINVCASVLRCVLSRPAGKWADRTSFAHVYQMGLWLCAFSFLLLMFTTPDRWWLVIGYTLCYHGSMAAIPGNANNMTYSYVPIDYFVQAQAIRSSIAGVLGFLASILGSRILSFIQANGNCLFGIPVYGQQVLAALSLFVILGAIAYNQCVISKQKIILQ